MCVCTVVGTGSEQILWRMTSQTLRLSRFRLLGRRAFVLRRVVVANAYSSDKFLTRYLYYMNFIYEIGLYRMGCLYLTYG